MRKLTLQKKNKKQNNKQFNFPKMRVFVQKDLPVKCSNCNSVLSRYSFQIHETGNRKNPEGRICNECYKLYISAHSFYKNSQYFDAINKRDADILFKEIAEAKQEKHERKMQKNQEINEEKQKAIEYIEANVLTQTGYRTNEWKNAIMKSSMKVVQSFVALYIVKKENRQEHWYFITGSGRKSNNIYKTVTIMGPESFMGRALIVCSGKGERQFNIAGSKYNLISYVCFNDERLNQLSDGQRREEKKADDTSSKKVYIYFRMNNKCLKNNHRIENVTAKTTNVKNELPVEVNVFHCLECDKYFINYEALQRYIERGIYPSLPFVLSEDYEGKLREASELMVYGYNVREGVLSETERHKILSWIIDSGLLSKAKIIKDLQFKVSYNGKKSGNENAKKKWEQDILYVSRYVKDNSKRIKPVFYR